MSFLKRYLEYIIIIALTIFAIMPLLTPGFFSMHDDEQIGRLYQLDKAIQAGQIPPRLAQDLGFGFDYPLFNFYPPFIYYVGEVFHLFGFSYIVSTKLMIGLGFIMAGIFMYFFMKEYSGKIGGIVAAIAYTYAPYHSVDVYVRGALPEFWSFAFIPALFWSFLRLAKTNNTLYAFVSALFVACLVLTHNLVAMMSSLFLGAFFIYLIISSKKKLKLFGKLSFSIGLGLAFSSYFWMPAFLEKNVTLVDLLTKELADYHLHFVYLRQFFSSPWGYGGSVPGPNDGLSFQVGKAQLFLALGSFLLVFFLLKKRLQEHIIYILFLFLFLFSLFIQTEHATFIWNAIQPFAYIQFPWRFLLFTAFTLAFLIGYMFVVVKKRVLQIFFAVIAMFLLIVMNKNYFVPEHYLRIVTDASYTAPEVIKWRTSLMSFEYTPKGIATKKSNIGNTVIAIQKNEIAKNSFVVTRGKMSVKQLQNIPQQKEFRVTVMQSGLLQLNTFSFPGWKTYIDGNEVPYTDKNKFKLVTVQVPKGQHIVRAVFTRTLIRVVSESITIIAILGTSIFVLLRRKSYGKN